MASKRPAERRCCGEWHYLAVQQPCQQDARHAQPAARYADNKPIQRLWCVQLPFGSVAMVVHAWSPSWHIVMSLLSSPDTNGGLLRSHEAAIISMPCLRGCITCAYARPCACAAAKQPGSAPDLGVVGMEKNGKQYVCTPYQPFGGAALPAPYGTSAAAAAPAGAADTLPPRFQDGSLLGLPAPAPEAASADPSALASAARQYVTSFRAQQPASGPAAAQAPAADPLFADLLNGGPLLQPGLLPKLLNRLRQRCDGLGCHIFEGLFHSWATNEPMTQGYQPC